MKNTIKIMLVSAVLCLPIQSSAAATKGEHWHQVGHQGIFHFVVVDKAKEKDTDIYHIAAGTLCTHQNICKVMFWSSPKEAAKKLPLTDKQLADRKAQWNLNLYTGYREWYWSSDIKPSSGAPNN